MSGFKPASFGVVHKLYDHQQSGSVAEYERLVAITPLVPLGAMFGMFPCIALNFACPAVSPGRIDWTGVAGAGKLARAAVTGW
jgi:hypothetical protein